MSLSALLMDGYNCLVERTCICCVSTSDVVIAYNLLISLTEEIHVFVFIIQFVLHVYKENIFFLNFQHSSCECPERNLV